MELLETIEIVQDRNFRDVRFPVQYVNRPNLNFRGYSGTMAAGVLRPGDAVVALPSGRTSRVKSIVTFDGELEEAFPPQAVTVTLEDEIDVSRGDLLARTDNLPWVDTRCNAHIVWMAEEPMVTGKQYYLKQAAKVVNGSVSHIQCRIDVNTLERHPAERLLLNEIGLCEVTLGAPLAFDSYSRCKATGSFILIDRITHGTVGAGMITGPGETGGAARRVTPEERAARFGQKAVTLWLRGENARELAHRLERSLFDLGRAGAVLDDEALAGNPPVLRVVARQLTAAGLICLCPLDAPATAEDAANWILDTRGMEAEDVLKLLQQKGVL
jgi:bifunctional enzyme CysN/CysC